MKKIFLVASSVIVVILIAIHLSNHGNLFHGGMAALGNAPYAYVLTGPDMAGPIYYSSGIETPWLLYSGLAMASTATPSQSYVYAIEVLGFDPHGLPTGTVPIRINVTTQAIEELSTPLIGPDDCYTNIFPSQDTRSTYALSTLTTDPISGALVQTTVIKRGTITLYTLNSSRIAISSSGSFATYIPKEENAVYRLDLDRPANPTIINQRIGRGTNPSIAAPTPNILGDTIAIETSIIGYKQVAICYYNTCRNINNGASNSINPSISPDGWIYWQNDTYGNWDIRGKKITSPDASFVQITRTSYNEINPAGGQGGVVYQSYKNGSNWDIYGSTNTTLISEFKVVASSADECNPYINSSNQMVYENNINGNWDIYAIGIPALGDPLQLTTSSANQLDPKISDSGLVIYKTNQNGNWDIYGRNSILFDEFPITNDIYDQYDAAVSNDYISYITTQYGNPEVCAKKVIDLNNEIRVTNDTAIQLTTALFNRSVVWEDRRSGRSEIYGAYLPILPQQKIYSAASGEIVIRLDISGNGSEIVFTVRTNTQEELPWYWSTTTPSKLIPTTTSTADYTICDYISIAREGSDIVIGAFSMPLSDRVILYSLKGGKAVNITHSIPPEKDMFPDVANRKILYVHKISVPQTQYSLCLWDYTDYPTLPPIFSILITAPIGQMIREPHFLN